MKSLTSVVLTIILLIGLTIFLSSMLAMYNHNPDHLKEEMGNKLSVLTKYAKNSLDTSNFTFHTPNISDMWQKRKDSLRGFNFSKINEFMRIAEEDDTITHDHLDHELPEPGAHHLAAPDFELDNEPEPTAAPITCQASFEPKCAMYPYVKFWNHRFHQEDCYESPLRPKLKDKAPYDQQKYILFEPDNGGWNNIRMAAEMVMILAHATGRTLVMPPVTVWYLLNQNKKHDENKSTFEKFYDFKKVREAMNVITMEEFLTNVAMKGLLKKPYKNMPNPATVNGPRLWQYLESACYVRQWEPGKMFIGLNITSDKVVDPVTGEVTTVGRANNIDISRVANVPIPRQPLAKLQKHRSRYNTMVAHGRKLVAFNATMDEEIAIYFPGDYRNTHRVLTHFYTYLYWSDYHIEQIYKRIVRDRLHYHDDIFCAAGRVVHSLHLDVVNYYRRIDPKSDVAVQSAAERDPHSHGGNTNKNATYFAYHIRRGDFQFKETRLTCEEIYNNSQHLLDPNITRLIYIATDEKNKDFFKVFEKNGWELRFLDDFRKSAQLSEDHNINQNHIGMIEQVICANAHTFIGTPRSSFTGYITRMRGYYRDGRYERTYYFLKPPYMYELQQSRPLVGPFWAREFEVASKNIDDYYFVEEDETGETGVASGNSTVLKLRV